MIYTGKLTNWMIQSRKNSWIPPYSVGAWNGRVMITWVTAGDEVLIEYLDTIGL